MFVYSVTSGMKLQPNCGSERAWVWSTPADFADEEAKGETLAIRFANVESKLTNILTDGSFLFKLTVLVCAMPATSQGSVHVQCT